MNFSKIFSPNNKGFNRGFLKTIYKDIVCYNILNFIKNTCEGRFLLFKQRLSQNKDYNGAFRIILDINDF